MATVEERLETAMTAPLDTFIAADDRRRLPAAVVEGWDLPAPDAAALAEWGLPTDLLLDPRPQGPGDPVLVPNVAGELERRLLSPADRLYELGSWGRTELTPKIGAVAGDGRVLAIRPAPVTADDLHPMLREHYAGLYQPAVMFINSSVAVFVEVAWRWRAALHALRHIQEPDWRSCTEAEFNAYDERLERCLRQVQAGVAAIDPAVTGEPESLWVELIGEYPL